MKRVGNVASSCQFRGVARYGRIGACAAVVLTALVPGGCLTLGNQGAETLRSGLELAGVASYRLMERSDGAYDLFVDDASLRDLAPLKGNALRTVWVVGSQVEDLSPLATGAIDELSLVGNVRLKDLSPLKGMRLTSLVLTGTAVSDLSPLAGMQLASLVVTRTQVEDLSPLAGMPLKTLEFADTRVEDVTPIAELPLRRVCFSPEKIKRGIDTLRAMTTLAEINGLPVPDFWARYDDGVYSEPTQ